MWSSTDPRSQPAPHLPPRNTWSPSWLQQSTWGFLAPLPAAKTLGGDVRGATRSVTAACYALLSQAWNPNMLSILNRSIFNLSQMFLFSDTTSNNRPTKIPSYLSCRNLWRPGRWKLLARRRTSRKVAALGSGDHMSSFCLLCEQKYLDFLSPTCITGEQPAANAARAAPARERLVFGGGYHG